jgi:DNA-binding MarR family transcriptional regulator
MKTQMPQYLAAFHSSAVVRFVHILTKRADSILRTHCNLSYTHFRVLVMLDAQQRMTQQDVAECLEVTAAAISRLTESLEQKQLIQRQENPANRRQNLMTLTSDGENLLKEAATHITKLETELYSEVTAADLKTFTAVANHLTEKLSV